MRTRTRLTTIGAAGTVAISALFGGTASADFPNFSDAPTGPGITNAIDIQSTGGLFTIDGLEIPVAGSFEIRGALSGSGALATIVPPAGTTGLFAAPVDVPGGLLDAEIPYPANRLTAQFELAAGGEIVLNRTNLDVTLPVKIRLSNRLIGSNYRIGSDSDPIALTLTTGTTAPPAPNAPISGAIGALSFEDGYRLLTGNRHVDNSFGLPKTSGGQFRSLRILLNQRFGLPSPAGTNSLVIEGDLATSF